MQDVLKKWQQDGRLPCDYEHSTKPGVIAPARFIQVTPDGVLLLLKEVVQGRKIQEMLQDPVLSAAAATADADDGDQDTTAIAADEAAVAAAAAPGAAADFSHDAYDVGDQVYIMDFPAAGVARILASGVALGGFDSMLMGTVPLFKASACNGVAVLLYIDIIAKWLSVKELACCLNCFAYTNVVDANHGV